MIQALGLLLVFQLGGEALSRLFLPAVPGPVLGLVLLAVALSLRPSLAEQLRATATGLLSHLSLLFVPAGVGVVAHLDLLAERGVALAVILVASTAIAIVAGAYAFVGLARLTGAGEEDQP